MVLPFMMMDLEGLKLALAAGYKSAAPQKTLGLWACQARSQEEQALSVFKDVSGGRKTLSNNAPYFIGALDASLLIIEGIFYTTYH